MADFYEDSARRRLAQIDAARARAVADLEDCRADGNDTLGGEYEQQIANLDADKRNLLDLHRRYVESQNPPQPPPLSPEERHAKPWDKMTWDDGLELARNSKYGKDLTWNDPNVQRGYMEAMRRKERGDR